MIWIRALGGVEVEELTSDVIERTICTELNIGHGRLQVESFCRFSQEIRRLDSSLIQTKVPRGYPHPCPGSLIRLS